MTPCIDAHQHLWDPSRFSYSWMAGLPALNIPHMLAEYRQATSRLDVLGTVYVDTDVDEKDLAGEAAMIFELADDPASSILGVVAAAKLERPNALAHLEPFRGHPKFKGVRRVLHTQETAVMEAPDFLANLEHLTERGLVFDLCARASQLPAALRLVERFPGLRFVLDHCGNPEVPGGALPAWKDDLSALAAKANVSCKISGMAASAEASWTAETFRPFVEHAIGCFGWDRVLWGGDWPVCTLTGTLERWFEAVAAITEEATDAQRAALFVGNAARVYDLQLPARA